MQPLIIFYGDYNSVTMQDQVAHISWADGREGFPRIYYARVDFGMAVNVVEIQPLSPTLQITNLYPQPASSLLNIDVASLEKRNVRVEILSMEGKILNSERKTLLEGFDRITIDSSSLPDALYLVRIITEDNYIIYQKIREELNRLKKLKIFAIILI